MRHKYKNSVLPIIPKSVQREIYTKQLIFTSEMINK